jgi:hypothetical protein
MYRNAGVRNRRFVFVHDATGHMNLRGGWAGERQNDDQEAEHVSKSG